MAKTSFEKFMLAQESMKKIDLATVDQNIQKINSEVDKAFKILGKGTNDIRQFLALAKGIKIDQAAIKELEKQKDTLQSMGITPDVKVDFAIENAEIIAEVVKSVNDALSKYLTAIRGYDI